MTLLPVSFFVKPCIAHFLADESITSWSSRISCCTNSSSSITICSDEPRKEFDSDTFSTLLLGIVIGSNSAQLWRIEENNSESSTTTSNIQLDACIHSSHSLSCIKMVSAKARYVGSLSILSKFIFNLANLRFCCAFFLFLY